ncbi:hypothetical protein [Kordiimonas sp.]|uniref:hypothetical protein n=1 Tax=Kordiimonas sp. TaxID=1970157 RepID=UPI003A913DC9
MLQSASPQQTAQTIQRWMKEWRHFKEKKAYDEGLLHLVNAMDYLHGASVGPITDNSENLSVIARHILHYYAFFIHRADIELIKNNFAYICSVKPMLGALHDAAGSGNFTPGQFWQNYAVPENTTGAMAVVRSLCYVTLANVHVYPGGQIRKIDQQLIAPMAMGCIGQRYALSEQQSRNKRWLIAESEHYSSAEVSGTNDTQTFRAWMLCSYLFWPQKHLFKQSLNRMITRWADSQKIAGQRSFRDRRIKKRPTIVIFAERFSPTHAMFRCHGKSASALKQHFNTILITDPKGLQLEGQNLFHRVLPMDSSRDCIRQNAKLIKKIAPDMIYYPSVGMHLNTLYLCNMRLAAIQFLSMGHPASTFSSEMDYVILNNDLRPDPSCFSEKIIHRKQSAGYTPYPGWEMSQLEQAMESNEDVVRIGVLAFPAKVSSEFVRLCKKLEINASRKLEFHFFSGSGSIDNLGYRKCLQTMLPEAIFHDSAAYPTYMNNVASMDFILSTFPFGNTNGTIDTLLAGKPMLALDGIEPHARTDSRLLRKIGAPDETIAKSLEEYYQTALGWIANPARLEALTQSIGKLDPVATFYSNEESSDFPQVVKLLYQTHEQLQASAQQEFEFEELEKFLQE